MNIERKLRRRRLLIARGPLTALLAWAGYHAIRRFAGREMNTALVAEVTIAAAQEVLQLADAGAFGFYDIRDSIELGYPPIGLIAVGDGNPQAGHIGLDTGPVVAWIEQGGMRTAGWATPHRLSADDLV